MINEIGMVVCTSGPRQLVAGQMNHGDGYGVTVPVRCPGSGQKPVAIWHTHPSGSRRLSGPDIQAGAQHRVPYVCVSNGRRGSTKCYRIQKKR